MREDDVTSLLLSARAGDQLLEELPAHLRPHDWAEARRIQDAQLAVIGPVGGYKVGASGATGPIGMAPLPLSGIVDSGATLVGWHQRWVEAEIAVKIGRDLPQRDTPYQDHELQTAVASWHPAIEVLNSRFRDTTKQDQLSLAADLIMHGGLVVGDACAMPDLAYEPVNVLINGQTVSGGKAHPAGDIWRLLRYLADEIGLKAGQIVTTGSWNPVTIAGENCDVVVRFAHAGEVRVRFTSHAAK